MDRGAGAATRGPAEADPPLARAQRHGDAAGDGAGDGVDVLSRVVDDLRDEVDGLHRALRYRAVIEQAKGVLVARTGCSPDEAFAQLVRRSQDLNRKLTSVAAAVVAHAIRHPAHDRAGQVTATEVDADASKVELAAAAFAAATDVEALNRTVLEELTDLDVEAAVLFVAEPDGSLRLLDAEGLDGRRLRGWDRIPPGVDVPLAAAMRTGRPVLLADREARITDYPGSRHVASAAEATASLPLYDGDRVLGVLGLTWRQPLAFDEALERRLAATAARCVPRLLALLVSHHDDELVDLRLEPGYDRWFHDLLDDLRVPAVLLEPRRNGDGRIVDLRLVHAGEHAGWDQPPRGTTAMTLRPQLAGTELLDRVRDLFSGATVWEAPEFVVPPTNEAPGVVFEALVLRRLGSLVIATWTRATSVEADDTMAAGQA